jgi:hypothetical protein
MRTDPFSLEEMFAVLTSRAGIDVASTARHVRTETSHDFNIGRLRIQATVWPDLGSPTRGRLTPEGMVAPFMEHVIANEGGY